MSILRCLSKRNKKAKVAHFLQNEPLYNCLSTNQKVYRITITTTRVQNFGKKKNLLLSSLHKNPTVEAQEANGHNFSKSNSWSKSIYSRNNNLFLCKNNIYVNWYMRIEILNTYHLTFACWKYIKPAYPLRILQLCIMLLFTMCYSRNCCGYIRLLRTAYGPKFMRLSRNQLSFKWKVGPWN